MNAHGTLLYYQLVNKRYTMYMIAEAYRNLAKNEIHEMHAYIYTNETKFALT